MEEKEGRFVSEGEKMKSKSSVGGENACKKQNTYYNEKRGHMPIFIKEDLWEKGRGEDKE